MMAILAAIAGAGTNGVVTLSGEVISDTGGAPRNARLNINADGTVDKVEDTTTTQIDTATDWIFPNAYANGDYDARYTNLSGDALDIEAAAEDIWIALSADRQWGYSTSSSKSGTMDFEIRDPGGTTVASTQYTLTATII